MTGTTIDEVQGSDKPKINKKRKAELQEPAQASVKKAKGDKKKKKKDKKPLAEGEAPRPKQPRQTKKPKPPKPEPVHDASKMSSKEYKALQEAAKTVASEPAEAQAEFLWQHCKRATQATDLERVGLSAAHIAVLAQPSTSGATLEERILATATKNLKKALLSPAVGKGSPLLLVVSGNAAIANHAIKHLPSINKVCRVAKLFSRHFKVPEQVKMLEGEVNAAVGTPNRLLKLIEEGALKLGRLAMVVLDLGQDLKMRTMLDMPETAQDFWALYRTHLVPSIQNGKCRVGLVELPPVPTGSAPPS